MLKPSDFNNAVPQFQNGNYASNPINPQYVEEPSSTDYNRGTEPLQTLPAQWWNWFMNKFTSRFNKVNIYVKNLFNELAQLLSLVNVTPDGTEGAVTDGQLKNAFKELYPDYINTKLALKSTYVKKTQKVNNHALSGDVTVTKSDVGLGNVPNVSTNDQTPTYTEASTLTALSSGEKLSIAFGKLAKAVSSLISHIANVSNPHSVTKAQVGLGSVVNTGDSATPVENGTTKFTTGGAYTLKKDLTDIAESLPTDAVLHYSFDEVPDYPDGTTDLLIQSFTSDTSWTVPFDITKSIDNGCLKLTSDGTRNVILVTRAEFYANVLKGKIIKLRAIASSAINCTVQEQRAPDYPRYNLTELSHSGNEYVFCGLMPSDLQTLSYLVFNFSSASSNNYVLIKSIYIGDGSYSTPIIDNANGQNNTANYSGVAVQGVSGKGLKCLKNNYVDCGNAHLSNNFTFSIWIKPDNADTTQTGEVVYIQDQLMIRNGAPTSTVTTLVLAIYTENNTQLYQSLDSLLEANVWTHLVITKNGTSCKVYFNGTLKRSYTLANDTLRQATGSMLINKSWLSNDRPQSYDDLLIFNRALTENEVTALYLNKANTPKYYNINNYILDNPDTTPTQNSTNLVTSGGVYTELAKKANTTYVDTELAKKVDKTTTVNGHALSGNVTVTKSDVDLGNVVNTGDSAVPVSGGTTKFTTGGAYNLLTSLAPAFSTSTSYAVGDIITYNGVLYTCTTAHSAGAWNERHFTICNLNTEFQKPANNIAEDFQINKTYMTGQLVIYNKELYKHIGIWGDSYSEWDGTKFQKVQMYANRDNRGTTISRYVFNLSFYGTSRILSLPALCAGSELVIRLDNDDSSSVTARFDAYHNYTLGVAFNHGGHEGISGIQKLTSGQNLTITVQANEYLEVTINYLKVDGDGIVNSSMFEYPIPSITKY